MSATDTRRGLLGSIWLPVLLVMLGFLPRASAADCCSDSSRSWTIASLIGVSRMGDTLIVVHGGVLDTLKLEGGASRLPLGRLPRGATIMLEATSRGSDKFLRALAIRVERRTRAGVFAMVLAALTALFALILRGRLRALIIGQDGRYSNSKFQLAVWFGALIVSYVTTIALRWWVGGSQYVGGVGIPEGLFVLSGFSALSFVGAKAVTQKKLDLEAEARRQAALTQPPGAAPANSASLKEGARARFPDDLFTDDHGRADLGDFQMLVVTLLAVSVYLVRLAGCLGVVELSCAARLPDVDSTILGTFGLGQGAYIAKKAFARVGDG